MLPDGVSLGRLQGSLANLATISPRFTGAVRRGGPGGTGFILAQGGKPYAAAFEGTDGNPVLIGDKAYRARSAPCSITNSSHTHLRRRGRPGRSQRWGA